MLDVLFVTVGTSAIQNDLLGALDGKNNQVLLQDVQRYLNDRAKPEEGVGRYGGLLRDLERAHLDFWGHDKATIDRWIDGGRYYRATSAELLSTYILRRTKEINFRSAVLLYSQTPEGYLAAVVNQSIMHSLSFKEKMGWHFLENVIKEPIPGLDKGRDKWFNHLPEIIQKFGTGEKRYRVNITGGYKGLAFAFGWLAQKAAKEQTTPYHLYYLHESLQIPMFFNERGDVSAAEDHGPF